MRSYLGFILLLAAAAAADVSEKLITTTTTTATPTTTTTATPSPTPTRATATKSDQRNKRQLGIPVYYDNFNANPTVEPLKPLQPLQPVAVVTPVAGKPVGQQQPGFPQNLPIVGTLFTNLPLQNLFTNLNLGQLGGPGNWGNWGNWGNLGQVGNLPGFGPTPKPPVDSSPAQTCPLTQKLSCRCEPLVTLPLRQPEDQNLVQILKQNARHNEDGSQELHLLLSNGHVLYQRTDKATNSQQGYYALPFPAGHYLNIRYSINQANYTIKAEVDSLAPNTDFQL